MHTDRLLGAAMLAGLLLAALGCGFSTYGESGGGGGIASLVEDTSPQLGGDLDTNGHRIAVGSGDDIEFASSPATRISGSSSQLDYVVDDSSIASLTGEHLFMRGDVAIADESDHSGTPGSGVGRIWTRDDTPTALIYTDDTGGDHPLNPAAIALSDGANISSDGADGYVFTVTLGGNRTLDDPSNLKPGATYLYILTQDGTGSRTLAYGSAFLWPGGAAPTLTTDADAVDVISCISDGTSLYCAHMGDFQ